MTVQDILNLNLPLDTPIRLISDLEDEENIWLHTIEVSAKGQSGYEVSGEIRLIG
jgi:hypothetical protein